MGQLALLAASTVVGFAGTAEASLIQIGTGGRGAIVWDREGDVSTMNNMCDNDSVECLTSIFSDLVSGFGIRITSDDLESFTLGSVAILLSPTTPFVCAINDPNCLSLEDYALQDDNTGWETRAVPNAVVTSDVQESPQSIIRLLTQPSSTDPYFFELTAASMAYLANMSATDRANSQVGIEVQSFNPNNTTITAFTDLAAPPVPAPVPEPGTLALVGIGLAGLARRRVRRMGASAPQDQV